MTVALGAAVGYLVARLLWILLRPTFGQPVFQRSNWRDRVVPTGAGVVIALAALCVEGGRVVAGVAGVGPNRMEGARIAVALAVAGMALLGLLDDLAGGGDARGFRGHLGALRRGHLTTGAVKLFGGLVVAAAAVGAAGGDGEAAGRYLADVALVALAANLANLLDRRPGRTSKAGLAAFVVLALATAAPGRLTAVAVVVGAAAGLLLDDLRERLMLGDAGANALGAALGIGVVVSCSASARTAVLVVLAGLNVASEVVSFSRVIEAIPPLRAADRWGRPA